MLCVISSCVASEATLSRSGYLQKLTKAFWLSIVMEAAHYDTQSLVLPVGKLNQPRTVPPGVGRPCHCCSKFSHYGSSCKFPQTVGYKCNECTKV